MVALALLILADLAVGRSLTACGRPSRAMCSRPKDDLEKVRLICGNTDCRPYKMLQDVIDGTENY